MTADGFNFSLRVRKVLGIAREEAAALGHEYVGTEHMLLALLRDREGVATAVLEALKVDLDELADRVREVIRKGRAGVSVGPDLPYTSRSKKALELAMVARRDMNHSYVGTEHLLLGLIREEKGIAAAVLAERGVTLENARAETLKLLGGDTSGARDDATLTAGRGDHLRATAGPPMHTAFRSVTVVVDVGHPLLLAQKFGTVDAAIEFLERFRKREG